MSLMKLPLAIVSAALLVGLAACKETKSPDTEGNADADMATVLEDTDGMASIALALNETGLDAPFEGAASYTLLAPDDAWFERIEESSPGLMTNEGRPALVALLRDHIIPGYITPEDIAQAIAASSNGTVTMRSMGDTELVFDKNENGLRVTGEDGVTVNLDETALQAGSSIAIPVDGALKPL